jgi:hypothetical protein
LVPGRRCKIRGDADSVSDYGRRGRRFASAGAQRNCGQCTSPHRLSRRRAPAGRLRGPLRPDSWPYPLIAASSPSKTFRTIPTGGPVPVQTAFRSRRGLAALAVLLAPGGLLRASGSRRGDGHAQPPATTPDDGVEPPDVTHIGRIRPARLADALRARQCINQSLCMAFCESAWAYWLTVVHAQP